MKFHFIGLGGIGMSALARILLQKGHQVQGSDAVESPLLKQLEKEGACIQVGHQQGRFNGDETVIYSSAVRESNVEWKEAKERSLRLLHRSDLLEELMGEKKALLVTGTHGKTTTTALLSSVLLEAGLDPSFVIGGILQSTQTNGRSGKGAYFVAEADESDGSFLKGKPLGAIVTNLEKEHLDYWHSEEALEKGFQQFFMQVEKKEHLFWCFDDPRFQRWTPPGLSYGFQEGADVRISSYGQAGSGIVFDLTIQGVSYFEIRLNLLGRHNALNAAAVFALALSLKVPESAIRSAFGGFRGTGRRLEMKGEGHGIQVYDDYGHHPTEIRATLLALREKILERRLIVVCQPHRFSRVRDCLDGFLHAFQEADLVVLTDIYSAGEAPLEGVSSAHLYTRMRATLGSKLHFLPRQHLEMGVAELLRPFDAVLTIGAGDITRAGEPILSHFLKIAPKYTVGVLFGGTSPEHSISLMSARNIIHSLDPSLYEVKLFGITKEGDWIAGPDALEKLEQKIWINPERVKISAEVLKELSRIDVAIPVFHGPQGEDGMIQGLLETLSIPYVGCDYRSAALCMQKAWTKQTALLNGVPTAPYVEVDAVSYRKDPLLVLERIEETLSYPVWVKPVHLGSSIGVSRVESRSGVADAIEKAFSFDDALIVEKEIVGKQIEFAVLGNEVIRIGSPCEILNHGAFYDFDRKYGPQAVGVEIPAKMTPLQTQVGASLAEKAYRASGCKGLSRVDFFLDERGYFWLNEINPFPGFTATSAYPKMWQAAGLSSFELLNELIILALHRSRKQRLCRSFG